MEQRIFISNKEQIEEMTIYFRIRSLERIFRIQRCERGTDREVSATVKLFTTKQTKIIDFIDCKIFLSDLEIISNIKQIYLQRSSCCFNSTEGFRALFWLRICKNR